jgi:phage terminase large subunit-like protein
MREPDVWRPLDLRGPECGYTLDGTTCRKSGAHHCEPRADRFVKFCAELLVHTSGPYARRHFVLEPWQEREVARPLFGEVWWSDEWQRYVRRFSVAYLVMARKNGKSSLAAAIVIYLLVGDDEEAAEVYGAAQDTKQARKVYLPVQRMVNQVPLLSARLTENVAARRYFDAKTGSLYEIITSDAKGELGHNPHGFVLDEVLSQPNRDLWDALRTAAGARTQPLLLAITTETNDNASFGAAMIDEAAAIQEDPARAPHVFAWVRKTPREADELARLREAFAGHPDLPVSADPWDERNWRWANPALGTFKSLEEMRRQALEARNDPEKENPFRQFQLNQRVQQVTRWMPMRRWDGAAGGYDEVDLEGLPCHGGLDLASTTDLACVAWLFPPGEEGGPYRVAWRFWTPEAMVPKFDEWTGGQASVWVRRGLLAATEGDWIDYRGDPDSGLSESELEGRPRLAIHPQLAADAERFRVLSVGYDPWQATSTAQFIQGDLKVRAEKVNQGYALSESLKDLMRLVKMDPPALLHGGHPVARWCMDAVEVRHDNEERIKLVKPDRRGARKRVDAAAALATALKAESLFEAEPEDEYTDPMSSVF